MADDIFTLFTLIKELLLAGNFKIPVNTYIQVETIHTGTSKYLLTHTYRGRQYKQ